MELFYPSPNSNMCTGGSGKLLRIYVTWELVYWTGLTFGRTIPYFFMGQRRKFYNGANGHFLLCRTNSQKPASGDRENYWWYMSHRWFSLTHARLGFGGPLPKFLQLAKTAI